MTMTVRRSVAVAYAAAAACLGVVGCGSDEPSQKEAKQQLCTSLDNFVRPLLIRKGANLPLLLIFAGVLGGLLAFGIIGLFIGPVVLAVTYTLLQVWVAGHEPKAERTGSDAAT